MSYSHVLFDLDGTLCDPGFGITDSVKYALQKMGITENDYEKLRLFVGPPLQHNFEKLYGMDSDTARKAVGIYREHFVENGIHQYVIYPGIKSMLDQLIARKIQLIVATSKIKPFAIQILTEAKIIDYFSYISADVPHIPRKKAETISEVLNYLQRDNTASIVMVGDKKHDIIGANSNKIDSIGVLYGYGSREELEEANATQIAKDVKELTNLLIN